VKPRAANDG